MTPPLPDGPLLNALTRARDMLRDCYWWRRIADPNNPWDAATAQSHIYFDGLPPPASGPDHTLAELQALRPFAILWTDTAAGLSLQLTAGGHTCAIPSGQIIMQLELPVPDGLANNPHNLAIDLARKFGRLLRTGDAAQPGLVELSGLADYLPLLQLDLSGYIRSEQKDAKHIGDLVVGEIACKWGLI